MNDVNIIGKYIHGSADSLDVDVIYVLDKIPDFGICKGMCASLYGNPNLVVIDDGVVTWCYKGSKDEVNNGLINTYHLHEQEYKLLVKESVERDLCLKVIRSIRGILSHMSRSCFRQEIKSALVGSLEQKLHTLESIDFDKIDFDSLNKNMSGDDIKKLIAFQIGQTLALVDGVEIFTKKEVGDYIPALEPYVYRRSESMDGLKCYVGVYVDVIRRLGIKDLDDRLVEYMGHKYDTKTEMMIE